MSIKLVMPPNHLILCCPLLLPSSISPNIRVFWNESALHIRWPKYWSFSFNISSSNEHPEPVPLRMNWLDLIATQGTLKSLLQQHSSVQFSRSVVANSWRPHESQRTRPPCPSPTPGVYSNSCASNQWCNPAISSSVIPFSSCLQSLPTSWSFQTNQLFASGGPSIGVSASTSVLPMNTQNRFPLGWTSWISLQSKGLSRVFSNTTVQKHQFFGAQPSLQSNSHIHTWPLEKP